MSTITSLTHYSADGRKTRCGIVLMPTGREGFVGIIETEHGFRTEYKTGQHDSNELCQQCAKLQ